jgi:hypothetical protein
MMADPETTPNTTDPSGELIHVLCCRNLTRSYCGFDFDDDIDLTDDYAPATCVVCAETQGDMTCWIDGTGCPDPT